MMWNALFSLKIRKTLCFLIEFCAILHLLRVKKCAILLPKRVWRFLQNENERTTQKIRKALFY